MSLDLEFLNIFLGGDLASRVLGGDPIARLLTALPVNPRMDAIFENAKTNKLREAARFMLETLSEMTTEQFSRGEDREARRRLATALGLDPDDYSL